MQKKNGEKMSKIKVSQKKSQIIVKTKLSRMETINQREIEIFNTKLIRGLMRPTVLGDKKINYVAPEGILLEEYLKREISKNDFFLVFAQINEVIKKVERYGFLLQNMLLDTKYVFINERTREAYFVYQPIIGNRNNSSIFTFLCELISNTSLRSNEDVQAVNVLANFLNKIQYYSTEEVEKCILQVYPEIYKQVHRESLGHSRQLHRIVSASINEEETGKMDEKSWNMLANEETGLLIEENEWEDQTSLLNDISEETVVLEEEMIVLEQQIYPYLIRKDTEEKIVISKSVFRLGKENRQVDFCIKDNNAISRLHAEIITREGRYFICDKNSTNHTYVDGEIVLEGQEKEIMDGNEIILANENFEFHI